MMNESKKEYEGIMNPNEYDEFIMNSFYFYYDKLDWSIESTEIPIVEKGFHLVFTGLTFVVSRGSYQCVPYGIQVLYTLFMKGIHCKW